MVDHNERNQGSDDLYDEAAPRSIFAATWFRAVLVLIVLGVIGAVAVPYILDAMNAPPGKLSATAKPPAPVSAPSESLAPVPPSATGTPPGPSSLTPPATAPTPSTPVPATPTTDKPTEKTESMTAAPTPEPAKAEPTPGTQSAASAEKPAAKTARAATSAGKRASGRQWFVQVGAFKDQTAAKKVATRLREDNYKVDESVRGGAVATVAKATAAPANSADRYDVLVSGQSSTELNERLAAKNLTAEAAGSGLVVKPSLSLREAVALSKELAVDGLKVQVRRAGGDSAPPARSSSPPTASAGDGDALHRVSVGGFADRATALAALKELEVKGYKPFLTRR